MVQVAQRADPSIAASILTACRMALEPWSTVDEKLAAISFLSSNPCEESLEALEQAFYLVGLSNKNDPSIRDQRIPKGGQVAGAAARGLAVCAEFGGLQILEQILLVGDTYSTFRETAAYGLSACRDRSVFSLYGRALRISNPDVRYQLLLSLRESLDRASDVNNDLVQGAIVEVCNLLTDRLNHLRGGERELVISILSRYSSPSSTAALIETLLDSDDEGVIRAVFEVLQRTLEQTTARELLPVLEAEDRPVIAYQLAGEQLARFADDQISLAAAGVAKRYGFMRKILSLFSTQERERRAAQLRAVEMIL